MDKTFWMGLGERPHYTGSPDESLAAMAEAAGEHPAETWLRLMLESEGKGLFHIRFVNEDLAPLPDFMRKDWIVPGVGDAGAHVGVISDVGWTSFLLSYWHRDVGEFSIEEAVHLLTAKQAKVLGFDDRGALAEGMKADINVLDVDRVEERRPSQSTSLMSTESMMHWVLPSLFVAETQIRSAYSSLQSRVRKPLTHRLMRLC